MIFLKCFLVFFHILMMFGFMKVVQDDGGFKNPKNRNFPFYMLCTVLSASYIIAFP